MNTITEFTKRAIRRMPGYPVGQPAPLYVECECGDKPAVPGAPDVDPKHVRFSCTCGITYNGAGYILSRPKEHNED